MNRTVLNAGAFRNLAKRRHAGETVPELDAPGSLLVVRAAKAEIGPGDGPLRLTFTISTAAEDRDEDTIAVDGWMLDNYKKNPVVLWAHDHDCPPIARSVETWAEAGKLKSIAEFTPEDLMPFGYMIYRLYQEGFMHAVSVGFDPVEWALTETETRYGVDFKKQDLLEYSAVPVPANPEALVQRSKGAGIDLAPLKSWCQGVLDKGAKASGLDRAAVETLYLAVDPSTVITLKGADDAPSPAANPGAVGGGDPNPTMPTDAPVDGASPAPAPDEGAAPAGEQTPAENEPNPASDEPQAASGEQTPGENETAPVLQSDPEPAVQTPEGRCALTPLQHHVDDGTPLFSLVARAMGCLCGLGDPLEALAPALKAELFGWFVLEGRKGLYEHLAGHYRELGMDPPEYRHVEGQSLKYFADAYEWVPNAGQVVPKGQAGQRAASAAAELEEAVRVKDAQRMEAAADRVKATAAEFLENLTAAAGAFTKALETLEAVTRPQGKSEGTGLEGAVIRLVDATPESEKMGDGTLVIKGTAEDIAAAVRSGASESIARAKGDVDYYDGRPVQ